MALPPPTSVEMRTFCPVLGAMELTAEFGYTTGQSGLEASRNISSKSIAPSPNTPYTEFKATGGADAQCQRNMTVNGRAPGALAHSLN